MKKLAFLFLIYDKIEQEDLWKRFFDGIDPERYVIHIHYKTQSPLKHFERFKLSHCIKTRYVDISIVHAHNLLLENALADSDVYKTINLSQSCIPLKSFNHVYRQLTSDAYSHFNECSRSSLFPRCDSALPYFNGDQHLIHKSSNWFILSRHHAKLCLAHPEYANYFAQVRCPEEHVHITTLKNEDPFGQIRYTQNLSDQATTFTNWPDMTYQYLTEKGLKTYSHLSAEEASHLLQSSCLFGRKFTGHCTAGSQRIPLSEYLGHKIGRSTKRLSQRLSALIPLAS